MNVGLASLFNDQKKCLVKAITKLEETYQKIKMMAATTVSEEELFEILTARFARLSDLYTQKLLGLLFRLLQEPDMSFIDRCHYLEKLGLINTSASLYEIRELRNQIAHEYATEVMEKIQSETMQKTPDLIQIIQATCDYIDAEMKKYRDGLK